MKKLIVIGLIAINLILTSCGEKVTAEKVISLVGEKNIQLAKEEYDKIKNTEEQEKVSSNIKGLIDTEVERYYLGQVSKNEVINNIDDYRVFDDILEYILRQEEDIDKVEISKQYFLEANKEEENKNYKEALAKYQKVIYKDSENYDIAMEKSREIAQILQTIKEEERTFKFGEAKNCDGVAEIRFDTYKWVDGQFLPSNIYAGYGYSYKEDIEGESYFVLEGEVKNTSNDFIDIMFGTYNKFKFNNSYYYTGTFDGEKSEGNGFQEYQLSPFEKVKCYLYVSVPDEMKEKYESCEVILGFNDMRSYVFNEEDCKNLYKVKIDQ